MRNFGWLPSQEAAKSSGGGFMGFFKKAAPAPVQATKRPSIVLFITDGDNSDKDRTRQVLRQSQERHDQIYFLFIGVHDGLDFPFLKQIGDEFDNTGLAVIRDVRKLMTADDDVLNDMLIGDELLTWLKK
ncbi:MAG: VWA domain-containing protein [Candidatus Uhrbacteria bacterium]